VRPRLNNVEEIPFHSFTCASQQSANHLRLHVILTVFGKTILVLMA
jgi:hypothetical protein